MSPSLAIENTGCDDVKTYGWSIVSLTLPAVNLWDWTLCQNREILGFVNFILGGIRHEEKWKESKRRKTKDVWRYARFIHFFCAMRCETALCSHGKLLVCLGRLSIVNKHRPQLFALEPHGATVYISALGFVLRVFRFLWLCGYVSGANHILEKYISFFD